MFTHIIVDFVVSFLIMFKLAIETLKTKLKIKTPEQCQWCLSAVFIVNLEHISHLALVLLLLTLNSYMPAGLSLKLFKLLLKVYLTNFMPLLAFYIP